jgi:hypothetical protein
MAPIIAIRNGDQHLRDCAKESVSQIASSMASRLTRSREGDPYGEPRQADDFVVNGSSCAYQRERLDEVTAATHGPSQMSHGQLSCSKPSADEYRGRVDACLNWAREATADEVRLACLTLARAWLEAAMGDDGSKGSDHLPLAPTL